MSLRELFRSLPRHVRHHPSRPSPGTDRLPGRSRSAPWAISAQAPVDAEAEEGGQTWVVRAHGQSFQ